VGLSHHDHRSRFLRVVCSHRDSTSHESRSTLDRYPRSCVPCAACRRLRSPLAHDWILLSSTRYIRRVPDKFKRSIASATYLSPASFAERSGSVTTSGSLFLFETRDILRDWMHELCPQSAHIIARQTNQIRTQCAASGAGEPSTTRRKLLRSDSCRRESLCNSARRLTSVGNSSFCPL
jgi:hypothetical protein